MEEAGGKRRRERDRVKATNFNKKGSFATFRASQMGEGIKKKKLDTCTGG